MAERSSFWLSHLSAIEAEGITTKAHADREGLSPQALCKWRRRVAVDGRRSRAKLRGFVPIRIEPSIDGPRGAQAVPFRLLEGWKGYRIADGSAGRQSFEHSSAWIDPRQLCTSSGPFAPLGEGALQDLAKPGVTCLTYLECSLKAGQAEGCALPFNAESAIEE